MSNSCMLYIDEAGDLGINRGTRWFVLSGVVIDVDDEPFMRATMNSIRSKFNLKELHFRKLRNFEQKAYAVNELCKCNFTYVNVIADCSKINLICKNPNDCPSIVTYNFACRLLLERCSWLLKSRNQTAKIILSSRGTSRDKELIDYIKVKLFDYPQNSINNLFTSITSKPSSAWDGLQLADVCATTMFYSHELNGLGFTTPCFTVRLGKFLYRHGKNVTSYGMKYYSEDMFPGADYYFGNSFCKIRP